MERRRHVVRALFEQNAIWIATTVILETEWVLHGAYKLSADDIRGALTKLFGLPHVTLGDQALIVQALDWYKQGLDFAENIRRLLRFCIRASAIFPLPLLSLLLWQTLAIPVLNGIHRTSYL